MQRKATPQRNLDQTADAVSNVLMPRSMQALSRELNHRFRPDRAEGVDMRVKLDADGDTLFIVICDGQATFDLHAPATADVTFLFEDLDTAWRILLGEASAIEAFMHGRFRADGYLMMAFRLMEMFDSASLPPTPND